MPIVCSCDIITDTQYRQAARSYADQIHIAKTFGAAVGMLFQATHPEEQKKPAEIWEESRCRGCLAHIGRAIVDENLRPHMEFERWRARLTASHAKSACKDCPKAGRCCTALTPAGC